MRKFVLLSFFLMLTMVCSAQERKFSPEKFEADLAAFITKEAKFTEDEAAKYFPLLREMHQKQRGLYKKARNFGKEKPATEEACANAIRERDKLEIEQRQIEQSYHKKMLQVLPASKLYDAIKAERRFHRQMMKGWQKAKPVSKGKCP
jgi:hypothetical protein